MAARGSFNNELGVPLTLLALQDDTEVLVTEIGARHEGDIVALAPWVAPDVAVVTAVAEVHLGVFGSLAAIARAKGVEITPEIGERRAGDPARLICSGDRIAQQLGWKSEHGLDDIVRSAVEARRNRA